MDEALLTGAELKCMFENGYKSLYRAEKQINDLNVFPIPDGDTGTNMAKTLGGGVYSVKEEAGNVSEIMDRFSIQTLLHARGNSGVILSQFVRGFASGCDGVDVMDVDQFADALLRGVEKAYTAVMKPVEGTMLTVIREGVEAFVTNGARNSFSEALTYLVNEMKISLGKTPEKLPVLKEAGVVDSGGLGMICIFEGMQAYTQGEEISIDKEPDDYLKSIGSIGSGATFGPDSVLEYGYCTEFVLQLMNAKTDVASFRKEDVAEFLEGIGDSIVVVLDGGILKVHVHTFEPEKVLAYARHYGEFISVKIENMSIQHNEFAGKKSEHYKYAVVAVANGDGVKDYFRQIGAARIVEGGQTRNPSAQDFVKIFSELDAESIVVLPNNSNIVLTAHQAKEICPEKDIHIIPTKSIAEGFSALSMMDTSAVDVDEFVESMTSPLRGVASVSITSAVHDACMNGVEVKDGEYMGIVDGELVASAKDRTETIMLTLEKIHNIDEKQVITVFRGESVSESDFEELADRITGKYPLMEIGAVYGGQDIYDFYMAVE